MPPPPLNELTTALARAEEVGDLDRLRVARQALVAAYPEAEVAAEAAFRLGLDALFVGQDLERAAEHFRAATKAKASPAAQAARTSLGLVLLRQGKHQQAVFELRRVGASKPPSLAAAQALSWVALSFRQQKNAKEADRARDEQLKVLDAVAAGADRASAALAHVLLGAEHKHDGRRDRAVKHLEAALASGALDADYQGKARALLATL